MKVEWRKGMEWERRWDEVGAGGRERVEGDDESTSRGEKGALSHERS